MPGPRSLRGGVCLVPDPFQRVGMSGTPPEGTPLKVHPLEGTPHWKVHTLVLMPCGGHRSGR